MSGRDLSRAEQLRAEVARITAAAQAEVAALVIPPGATRQVRAQIRAARRAVWAEREARIKAATGATQGPTRAQRSAANKAAHQSTAVPEAIRHRRTERVVRRAEQASGREDVRRAEQELYRRQEQSR